MEDVIRNGITYFFTKIHKCLYSHDTFVKNMGETDFRGQVLHDVVQQKLDLLDRKILYLLSQNCRVSNTAIASHLKTSREVVAYRIEQLLKKKVITGFFTLIDSRKLGFMTFTVLIKLINVTKENEIVSHLFQKEEITSLILCSGRYDIYFEVTTVSSEEFESFMNAFLLTHANSINDHTILHFLQEDHMGDNFTLEQEEREALQNITLQGKGSAFSNAFKKSKEEKQQEIDDKDREILKCVLFNARMPLKEIASKTDLSPTVVKTRMASLITSGAIKHFMPLTSFSAFGYQWFMVFLNIVGIKEQRLSQYMLMHPNIEWGVRCIGPWNNQVSIFARNSREFHAILNDIRGEFKENIIFFDSILVFNQLKFGARISRIE